MNLSIYNKLRIADKSGKVKINPDYKYLDYMIDKDFISPIQDQIVEINGHLLPGHDDWYTITTDGQEAMLKKQSDLITRLISLIALFTSIGALAINYFTNF